jgi:hypothetical protein
MDEEWLQVGLLRVSGMNDAYAVSDLSQGSSATGSESRHVLAFSFQSLWTLSITVLLNLARIRKLTEEVEIYLYSNPSQPSRAEPSPITQRAARKWIHTVLYLRRNERERQRETEREGERQRETEREGERGREREREGERGRESVCVCEKTTLYLTY